MELCSSSIVTVLLSVALFLTLSAPSFAQISSYRANFEVYHHADACINAYDEYIQLTKDGCKYNVRAEQGYCKNNVGVSPISWQTFCESHEFETPWPIKDVWEIICLPSSTELITDTKTGTRAAGQPSYCPWNKNIQYTFMNITGCKCDRIKYVP